MDSNKITKMVCGALENTGYDPIEDSSSKKLLDEHKEFKIYSKTSRIRNLRKLFVVIQSDGVDIGDIEQVEEDVQMIIGKYANKGTFRQKKVIGHTIVVSKNATAQSLLHTKQETGDSSASQYPFFRFPLPVGVQAGSQTALIDAENEIAVVGDSGGLGLQKKFWKRSIQKVIPAEIQESFEFVDASSEEVDDVELEKATKLVHGDSVDVGELNQLLQSSNRFKLSFVKVLESRYPDNFNSNVVDLDSLAPKSDKLHNLGVDIDTSNDSDVFKLVVEYKEDVLISKSVKSEEVVPLVEATVGKILVRVPHPYAKALGGIFIGDAKRRVSGKFIGDIIEKGKTE